MLNDDILKDLECLGEQSEDMDDDMIIQEQNQDDQQNIQKYHNDEQGINFRARGGLLKDQKFITHMKDVNQLIDKKIQNKLNTDSKIQKDYIHKSNQYAQKIDRQIYQLYRFVKTIYNHRFPQLQSIVTKRPLYCRAAYTIQNHFDKMKKGEATSIQQIKLPFLSSHQVISLKIAISSLHEELPIQKNDQLYQLCQDVALLNEHHNALMIYLESSMQIVAPNLCQFVGSAIASKLISAAGGIDKLANMPACNVQLLGGQRAAQVGFALMQRNHTGIFGQMDLVKQAPKKFQMQLVRMLATNTVKCAKADFLGSKNNLGARFKQQMFQRFQKVQQEGGLMRTQKPMQIPDLQPKKKRGGKRHRKMKQLYQMTQVRKQQNRLKFGQQAQEQYGQQGEGLGMLKASGLGKLKVNIKKQKLNVSKKMNERMNKKSGMQSSFDFGSKQGIQLVNPDAIKQRVQQKTGGTQSYFAKQSGFRTILNNKFGLNKKQ